MAIDKTIFELPFYSAVGQLDGAQRMPIQASSSALADYGLTLTLLAQWIQQNYIIGVSGGSANPDNAAGNNGDLYFQANGQVKQKISGVWVLKATITGAVTPPTPTDIIAGTTPTPLTIAYAGNPNTGYTLKRITDNSFDNNTRVTYDNAHFVIYGEDNGSGKFIDGFIFAIKP